MKPNRPQLRRPRRIAVAVSAALMGTLMTATDRSVAQEAAQNRAQPPIDRVLTILSSPGPETQAMALVLSNQLADRGMTVHVLLCDTAGDLALADPPDSATAVVTPRGGTPRGLLEGLQGKGAQVDVCAIYLPNRSLQADALMEGVGAARPPDVAALMADPAVRVFTF